MHILEKAFKAGLMNTDIPAAYGGKGEGIMESALITEEIAAFQSLQFKIAKMYASEAAMEVVNEALQMFGGYGYAKTFPIKKLFRDTRLFGITWNDHGSLAFFHPDPRPTGFAG